MEQNTCNKCGRPMQYATEPKCNYCDACMNEYCGCKLGRIKEVEPTCDSTAVIPSITVESVEGITNLANCLVHVEDINTTFYVDDKHRVMITWAGPVNIPGYDIEGNPNHYKDQIVMDTEAGIAVIYDKHGVGYTFGIEQGLDVQEEVNNTIAAMAESGELQTIISQYTGFTKTYNTQTDLENDDTIESGFAKTLGIRAKGDGFGALYEIGDTGDIELASGAFATMVQNFGGDNYYDLPIKIERHYDTTCYIVTIPLNDANGDQVDPYVDLCQEGPLKYSQDNHTSLTINASLGTHTLISNGELLQNRDSGNVNLPDAAVYLSITSDRLLKDFKANTATYQSMISGGAKEAWLAYYKIINNGVFVDFDWVDDQWQNETQHIATDRHPRQCIGQKQDKTLVILTTDGRRSGNWGLTSEQCAEILRDEGCINAWNLDGGGSTSTSLKGYKVNGNIDGDFTVDRNINACLNVKNLITDEELGEVNSNIGSVTQMNNAKLMKLINQAIVGGYANGDANDLVGEQSVKYVVNASNAPYGSGYLVTIPISAPEHSGNYAGQLFIDRRNGRTYTRTKFEGTFNDWKPTEGYKVSLYSRSNSSFTSTLDDTYETITYENNIIYSNVGDYNPSFFTINENSELVFSGSLSRVTLTITFDLTTTNVQGTRYMQVTSGGSIIANSVSKFQPGAIATHTITATGSAANPIAIQYYGKTGDQISRIKVVAESFD